MLLDSVVPLANEFTPTTPHFFGITNEGEIEAIVTPDEFLLGDKLQIPENIKDVSESFTHIFLFILLYYF